MKWNSPEFMLLALLIPLIAFYKFFVSDKTDSFVDVANIFLGGDLIEEINQIDITKFR